MTCNGGSVYEIAEFLLCRKIFCVMYYKVEIMWLMLHSAV